MEIALSRKKRWLLFASVVFASFRGVVEFVEAFWSLFSPTPLVLAISGYIPHMTDFPLLSLTTPIGLMLVAYVLFSGRRPSAEGVLADSPWVQNLPALAQHDASSLTSRVVATVIGWDW